MGDELRRIDLYAAKVCRDFGLEVPKEWRPTLTEWAEDTMDIINEAARVVAQAFEPIFKALK